MCFFFFTIYRITTKHICIMIEVLNYLYRDYGLYSPVCYMQVCWSHPVAPKHQSDVCVCVCVCVCVLDPTQKI